MYNKVLKLLPVLLFLMLVSVSCGIEAHEIKVVEQSNTDGVLTVILQSDYRVEEACTSPIQYVLVKKDNMEVKYSPSSCDNQYVRRNSSMFVHLVYNAPAFDDNYTDAYFLYKETKIRP